MINFRTPINLYSIHREKKMIISIIYSGKERDNFMEVTLNYFPKIKAKLLLQILDKELSETATFCLHYQRLLNGHSELKICS